MAKATERLPPAAGQGNDPPVRLSLNQAAAALVALLNGAEQVPPIGQLRRMVRQATARSQTGGRHHG
jgi:hypothetical protein